MTGIYRDMDCHCDLCVWPVGSNPSRDHARVFDDKLWHRTYKPQEISVEVHNERPGRISLRPPLSQRHIKVYDFTDLGRKSRQITSITGAGSGRQDACAWCERVTTCYDYRPADYGWPEDLIWCCCWACYHQWLDYRDLVRDEIDCWLLFGVMPEVAIPNWYLPAEVVSSLQLAARSRIDAQLESKLAL